MYRTGRSPAARQTRAASSKRNWGNSLLISEGPAGPCVSLITGKTIEPAPPKIAPKQRRGKRRQHLRTRPTQIRWPIYVTEPTQDGSITTLIFHSREAADLAGFSWIGR